MNIFPKTEYSPLTAADIPFAVVLHITGKKESIRFFAEKRMLRMI